MSQIQRKNADVLLFYHKNERYKIVQSCRAQSKQHTQTFLKTHLSHGNLERFIQIVEQPPTPLSPKLICMQQFHI